MGVTVVFDADVLAYDSEIGKIVELTDILMPSNGFAQRFTNRDNPEKALEIMRAQGPSLVLITLGDEGSVCLAEDRIFYTPSFEVNVVDTTGAGDVFHGAFICGMLRDWPLEKVAEFASAVAGIKCTKLGGRLGIPTFKEAMRFLKDRDAKYFD